MNRALPLVAALALVASPRLAVGGVHSEDGPVKVPSVTRPNLTGRVLSITWVGQHGRAHQRLSAPRPLDDLGTLTPPAGDWDAVVLHLNDARLGVGETSTVLPSQTLEVVLSEPVTGGAPLQLALDLDASDLDGLQGADAIQAAIQDAAVLLVAPPR